MCTQDIQVFPKPRAGLASRIPHAGFAVLFFLWTAAPTSAQNPAGKTYDSFKVEVSRAEEVAFNQMLNSGAVRDEAVFRKGIQKRILDLSLPENKTRMADLRRAIKNQLQRAGQKGGQEAHAKANELLLLYLPKIAAEDRWHPGARYNWALLLGQLDTQEPDLRGLGAQPMAAALQPLLVLLADTKQIDAVHVATMVGILRHAETGLATPQSDTVAAAMIDYLARLEQQTQESPGLRAARGQAWLEMRAINVLGALGVTNDNVLTALGQRMADASRPLWLRCSAARALGNLDVSGNVQVDAQQSQQLAEGLSNLVVTVSQQNADRRSLRWSLECVKDGLTGGAATKIAAPHDESSKRWAGGIQNLLVLFEDKTLSTDELLAARLKQEVEDIRKGQAVKPAALTDAQTDTTAENSDPPPAAASPTQENPLNPFQ